MTIEEFRDWVLGEGWPEFVASKVVQGGKISEYLKNYPFDQWGERFVYMIAQFYKEYQRAEKAKSGQP